MNTKSEYERHDMLREDRVSFNESRSYEKSSNPVGVIKRHLKNRSELSAFIFEA